MASSTKAALRPFLSLSGDDCGLCREPMRDGWAVWRLPKRDEQSVALLCRTCAPFKGDAERIAREERLVLRAK